MRDISKQEADEFSGASEPPIARTSKESHENLVAELEAAAAKWVLEKNKYTLESLRDARRAVLKQMQAHGIETGVQLHDIACGSNRRWPCDCGAALKAVAAPADWDRFNPALGAPTELPQLCEDCPPAGYPTDKTRCTWCPRRAQNGDEVSK